MTWLLVVLGGHFANALAFVVDKILLTSDLKHPSVYVFYIGALGLFGFILWPFGSFYPLPALLMWQAFLSGAGFMLALLCFFSALKRGEATRVVPFIGGLVPIWTILFAGVLLSESLTGVEWLGIGFLILGAVLISYEKNPTATSITRAEVFYIISAAGLFALSYTLAKVVFNGAEFINAFLWMRLFAFVTVLPLLLLPLTRRLVFSGEGKEKPTALFFVGQASGAIGFILLNWGIELAPSVSVVNALQGVQYAFLFIIIIFVMRLAPKLIRERLTKAIIIQKVVAFVALAIGLVLVA